MAVFPALEAPLAALEALAMVDLVDRAAHVPDPLSGTPAPTGDDRPGGGSWEFPDDSA
jgi:hypothetical protein